MLQSSQLLGPGGAGACGCRLGRSACYGQPICWAAVESAGAKKAGTQPSPSLHPSCVQLLSMGRLSAGVFASGHSRHNRRQGMLCTSLARSICGIDKLRECCSDSDGHEASACLQTVPSMTSQITWAGMPIERCSRLPALLTLDRQKHTVLERRPAHSVRAVTSQATS